MNTNCQSTNNTKPALLRQLIKAKNIMDEDVSRKVDIAMLASEATLSRFHFFKCFKNAFGMSPYQYLINKRLERSMELLKEGTCQVTDVAYEVGFTDIYSFSRSFKKHFKMCPSSSLHPVIVRRNENIAGK
ncbi:MAG: AraC family transcriptional regulator [Ginsengibacter sp.]